MDTRSLNGRLTLQDLFNFSCLSHDDSPFPIINDIFSSGLQIFYFPSLRLLLFKKIAQKMKGIIISKGCGIEKE
jgi:hypothetical protein